MLRKSRIGVALMVSGLFACVAFLSGAAQAGDESAKNDKRAPSGVWEQKQGDLKMKVDFSEKGVVALFLAKEDKSVLITCDYTLAKDARVKAKITDVQAQGVNVNDKLPRGLEFTFQWDDAVAPREGGLALFDAFGSREKTMHINPGAHGAIPVFEEESWEAFFLRHLGG